MANLDSALASFSGVARLFPLPNLVLFPHVAQPLLVFESRYIEMLEDALANDQLLATSLLLPGWESEYDGRPPIDPILCLGQVVSHSLNKDGRYHILLAGLSRAEIVRELPACRSFREAEVQILPDLEPTTKLDEANRLQRKLADCFRRLVPACQGKQKQQLDETLSGQLPLGPLTDLVAYSLPLGLDVKQVLLAEVDVLERARLLLKHLRTWANQAVRAHVFPPAFSAN